MVPEGQLRLEQTVSSTRDWRRVRRVLHPTDFSTLSDHAFAEAIRWAKTERAELLLLHVVAPVAPIIGDEYGWNPWLYPETNRAIREGTTETLCRLLLRAQEKGVRGEVLVLEGLPANQIVHAAKTRDVDLIVMGSHGRTGFARLIFGTLAEDVVAEAPCPVLLVGKSALQEGALRRPLASAQARRPSRPQDGAGERDAVRTLDKRRGKLATLSRTTTLAYGDGER